jgi:hypothetical protein
VVVERPVVVERSVVVADRCHRHHHHHHCHGDKAGAVVAGAVAGAVLTSLIVR